MRREGRIGAVDKLSHHARANWPELDLNAAFVRCAAIATALAAATLVLWGAP